MRNPVRPSFCVTPAGTSNELDVQNKWEERDTHTHARLIRGVTSIIDPPLGGSMRVA